MKTVILTALSFFLILCFIFLNSSFINKTSDKLCVLVQNLPDVSSDTCVAAVDILFREWRSCRFFIELSAKRSSLLGIDDSLSSLKAFALFGRAAEFEECRSHLKNAFAELRRAESLNLFDIF